MQWVLHAQRTEYAVLRCIWESWYITLLASQPTQCHNVGTDIMKPFTPLIVTDRHLETLYTVIMANFHCQKYG